MPETRDEYLKVVDKAKAEVEKHFNKSDQPLDAYDVADFAIQHAQSRETELRRQIADEMELAIMAESWSATVLILVHLQAELRGNK